MVSGCYIALSGKWIRSVPSLFVCMQMLLFKIMVYFVTYLQVIYKNQ